MPDFTVTPYDVEGSVDYNRLMKQFGIAPIDEKLLKRINGIAGGLHFLLSRGIFFANRDMNWLLDEYEKGNRFYLYNGIAPSGSMTVAHLISFMLEKWLQDKFGAEVLIQIPDEEKALINKVGFDEVHKLAYEDALNIAALGFDPEKTKIFFNTDYAKTLYGQAVRVAKHITFSMVKDAFGFTNENNIGSIFYTSMQAVPAFLKSVQAKRNIPCLIPLGVDQDVHFRLARDALAKMGYYKPAILHAKFMPGLSGNPKMSASDPNDAIYLSDGPEEVKRKVQRAFTGQQATAELQRKHGGDPDKCVVCQYYRYIFEPDDKKLEKIFSAERNGTMLAGEHKKDLEAKINSFLNEHKKKREALRPKLESFFVRD